MQQIYAILECPIKISNIKMQLIPKTWVIFWTYKTYIKC